MKISIGMKTPDCVHDAVVSEGLSRHEFDRVMTLSKKWFEYGEYVTLVLDTEAGTCVVEQRG
jgi:hypothetical protein